MRKFWSKCRVLSIKLLEKIRVYIVSFKLLGSYKEDIALLQEMTYTVNECLNGTSNLGWSNPNYNVVSMDIRMKYLYHFTKVFPKKMSEINKLVLEIKRLKNKYDLNVKAGKKKFIIDGKVYWSRSYSQIDLYLKQVEMIPKWK